MRLQFPWFVAFLLALASPSIGWATHLLGGEMTYAYVSTNASGWHTYEVRVIIYRDCSSANVNGTGFDLAAHLGVYTNGTLVSDQVANFDASTVVNIIPQDPNACAELPDDLCIERGEYIFSVNLAPISGSYQLTYQRCCRTPAIVNLDVPGNQGFSLMTEIPGQALVNAPNSSPVFNELPQAFICNNLPFELDNSAMDPDGDSLAYSLCPIYLGGTYSAPTPIPPLGPPYTEVSWGGGFNSANPVLTASGISIDPVTGMLTGTPVGLGKYAMGVCVEEWRDGVMINSILRDFSLDVVACLLSAPFYSTTEPCTGLDVFFDQTSNPAETYDWDFGFDGPDGTSTEAEPNISFPEPGIYTVELGYTNGDCVGETEFTILAQEPWTVEMELGEPECTNGGWWVSVEAPTGLPENCSYTWDFGNGAQPSSVVDDTPSGVLLPADGTSIIEIITESFGCIETDLQSLQLDPLPSADFEVETPPCRGLTVEFVNEEPLLGPFSWSFGDGTNANGPNPVHTYPAYGPYTISVIAGAGTACADTAWQSFSVYPLDPFEPAFDVNPITSCDSLSRVQITYLGLPTDGLNWSFPTLDELADNPVVLLFQEPGNYSGVVTLYHAGCDLTFEVPLDVEAPESLTAVEYVVPNVFSPNNDGRNERFELDFFSQDGLPVEGLTNQSFSTHRLEVYNRWGSLMFATEEALGGWRGTDASEGTYYVIVHSQHACSTSPFEYHGEVTLVR